MNMANCVGLDRRDRRCGLVYLMELFTGNRQGREWKLNRWEIKRNFGRL